MGLELIGTAWDNLEPEKSVCIPTKLYNMLRTSGVPGLAQPSLAPPGDMLPMGPVLKAYGSKFRWMVIGGAIALGLYLLFWGRK